MAISVIPTPTAASPRGRDIAILCVASVASLAPFLGKPANIDDPLFLWTAEQIAAHPLDFYAFKINWAGCTLPMLDQMFNPPLLPYYLAGVAKLFGWSESALHAALLPFSLLSTVGIYLLATQFCRFPLLAGLLMLGCPAFLVSSTTLMSEVPLLCLWIWAVLLWIRGTTSIVASIIAAVLVGLAMLTKYSAICLLPLLITFTLTHRASRGNRIGQYLSLLIPIAMIVAYNSFTAAQYGRPLLLDAVGFSSAYNNAGAISAGSRLLDAFIFLGGGALIAAVLGFIAATLRVQIFVLVLFAILVVLSKPLMLPGQDWTAAWVFCIQAGFLAIAGLQIVMLCVQGLRRTTRANRADVLFLLLWIGGVFIFAAQLNWSINARSILPLVPPVCILTARAMEQRASRPLRPYVLGAAAAALVAILATVADFQTARGNQLAADSLARKYPDRKIWFVGHWGFQYYMQQKHALPLEDLAPACRPKDLVVIAINNYGHLPHSIGMLPIDGVVAPNLPFMTLQNAVQDAGFYFSPGNRLPFVFGSVHPDEFVVLQVVGNTMHPRPCRRRNRPGRIKMASGQPSAREGNSWRE